MIVAVSALGKEKEDVVDLRFGRCNFFHIYNLETGEFKAVENKGNTANEGAGIAASSQIVDENVEVVITGKVGPNAYKILKESSIKMYSSVPIKSIDAVNEFKDSKLNEIVSAGAAHSGLNKQ